MSDTTDKKGLKYFGIIHNIPKNLLKEIKRLLLST
jgi:hypothetical protein